MKFSFISFTVAKKSSQEPSNGRCFNRFGPFLVLQIQIHAYRRNKKKWEAKKTSDKRHTDGTNWKLFEYPGLFRHYCQYFGYVGTPEQQIVLTALSLLNAGRQDENNCQF